MYERYFVLRTSLTSDDNNLLGKYGHRVLDFLSDGFITKLSADNLCNKKSLSGSPNNPVIYSVIKIVF